MLSECVSKSSKTVIDMMEATDMANLAGLQLESNDEFN